MFCFSFSPETQYRAVDDSSAAPPLPPDDSSALIKEAQAQRPDLQALRLDTQADQKFARAQELQRLPSISALAMGGVTPVRPDGGIFTPNWFAAAGVNLTLPVFTGFRINAQAQEVRLRERASEKQILELSDANATSASQQYQPWGAVSQLGRFQRPTAARKWRRPSTRVYGATSLNLQWLENQWRHETDATSSVFF